MLEKRLIKILIFVFLATNLHGVSLVLFNKAQQEHNLALDNQNKKFNINLALSQSIYMSSAEHNFLANKHIQLIHLDYVLKSIVEQETKTLNQIQCEKGKFKGGICKYYNKENK